MLGGNQIESSAAAANPTATHSEIVSRRTVSHTARKTRQFFAQQAERLTVFQLPSYSPDYNPIEYLWRNVKKEATHLKYFPTFEHLVTTVETTLADFQRQPERIKALFGRYLDLMAQAAA